MNCKRARTPRCAIAAACCMTIVTWRSTAVDVNATDKAGIGRAGATFSVAASDSRNAAGADFTCDGRGDQEEIQAAIDALPAGGGSVMLLEGTYDIRRVDGTLGGVTINRSDVCLRGCGWGTRLVLADNQLVNVIRVIGDGVGRVTIRDLAIDANREHNSREESSKLLGGRFESCGIRIGRSTIKPFSGALADDVTVESCRVTNATYLGIMAFGRNMVITNNHLSNASSDAVEVLGGPARITNNYVMATGPVHVAIGTDAASDVIISNNQVICEEDGTIDIGIRTWAGTYRTMIVGNVVLNRGGRITQGMEIRGNQTTVVGNTIANVQETTVTGQGCILNANTFSNAGQIRIRAEQQDRWPIVLKDNHLYNTGITVEAGNVRHFEPRSDHFTDCLAATSDHVGSWQGTGEAQQITTGIRQPGVPRVLSVTCVGEPAAGTAVTVEGVDAKGNTISEAFALTGNGTTNGDRAFATVATIRVPAAVGAAHRITVGTTDRLGLSAIIYATDDVFRVRRNADVGANGVVDPVHGTVDCAPVAAGDDITIDFRSSLNTLIR